MCRAAHRSWDVERREETRASASMDDALRVSDDDRRRVIEQLRTHTADGRLSLDEFAGRVGEAWGSTTYGELRSVLRDLPGAATTAPQRPVHRSRPRPRAMPLPLLVALLVVVGSVLMSHFAWWLIPVGFWVFGGCRGQRARSVDRRADPVSV